MNHISAIKMHFQIVERQILSLLSTQSPAATWMAQAVVSLIAPGTPGPALHFYTHKLCERDKTLYQTLINLPFFDDSYNGEIANLFIICQQFLEEDQPTHHMVSSQHIKATAVA